MLIGIMGKAGSGKDTIADHLCKEFVLDKYSLSTPIKEGLAAMLGEPLELMNDREARELPYGGLGKSIREMLQTLGTEWGRNVVHPDIWVNLAISRGITDTVIPDIRFRNEVDAIRKKGGILFWVERSNNPLSVPDHSSENSVNMLLADDVFYNDGTIDDLRHSVSQCVLDKYV